MIRNPRQFIFQGFIYMVDEKFEDTVKQMLIPYEGKKVQDKPIVTQSPVKRDEVKLLKNLKKKVYRKK